MEQKSDKGRGNAWITKIVGNGFLVCVSLSVSFLLGDGLFRVYEAHLLSVEYGLEGDTIYLDKQNYNDTHVQKKKAADEFRVLSFGDSFAYTITKYPYSYHGIAASLLNAASSGKKIRIVNLGEPAITFPQYIRAYEHWGPLIEHDAVVFNVYLGNDILEVAHDHIADTNTLNGIFGTHTFNLQTGQPRTFVPRKYPLRSWDYVYAYYRTWRGDLQTPLDAGTGKYNLALRNLSEETYYFTLNLQMENFAPRQLWNLRKGYRAVIRFARFAAQIRAQGKPVLILLSPNETQVTPRLRDKISKRLNVDMARFDFSLPAYLIHEIFGMIDPDVAVLDLSKSFVCATHQGQDLFFGTDTHCSAEGNELAGRNLTYYIGTQWLSGDIDPAGLPAAPCAGHAYALNTRPETTPLRYRVTRDFLVPLFRRSLRQ